jgi:hypothetical protein
MEVTADIYETQNAHYLTVVMSLVSDDHLDATRQYIPTPVAVERQII